MKQSPQTLAIIGFPVIAGFFAIALRRRWPERLVLQSQLQEQRKLHVVRRFSR